MIFFKRKKDETQEKIISDLEEVFPNLPNALGIREAKWRRKKNTLELLGRMDEDKDIVVATVVVANYLGKHLQNKGYQIVEGQEIFKVSDLYRETGSLPMNLLADRLEKTLDTSGTYLVIRADDRDYIVKISVMKIFGRLGVSVTVEPRKE